MSVRIHFPRSRHENVEIAWFIQTVVCMDVLRTPPADLVQPTFPLTRRLLILLLKYRFTTLELRCDHKLCYALFSFFAVHRECARHWCRKHDQPTYIMGADEQILADRVLKLTPPLRHLCTNHEESFHRRFPIYILQETIEKFDSIYGSHNERALTAVQGILNDLVCFLSLDLFPFCFILYLDDIIVQRDIPVEAQDILRIAGLERSLLLLMQIYLYEVSFHSVTRPIVDRGYIALETLLALITTYEPSVGWNHSPANADGDTLF